MGDQIESPKIQYRRLRVPAEHGQYLIDPPLSEAADLLAANRKLLAACDYDLQGCRFPELAQQAREDLVNKALAYTNRYLDTQGYFETAELDTNRLATKPLILSGHQPTLFHAGVWVKNFGLSSIARTNQAVAINLIIDNDMVKSRGIEVPSGKIENPILERIDYDILSEDQRAKENQTYETTNLNDQKLFQSFANRVAQAVKPFVENPLISKLWPLADEQSDKVKNLGLMLAQARHRYEQQLGLQTLEVPLSEICQSHSFHWFTTYLLANLPRFWEIYNQSIAEYREVHKIKNAAQPLPVLSSKEQWLEAPFWLLTEDGQRRAMFVRKTADALLISDRSKTEYSLPIDHEGSLFKTVEVLQQLSNADLKIRPRALITTMYARLFLSDLFIHGIGGAKYDQITDLIIQRFFQLKPPVFITMTATALLPTEQENRSDQSLETIANHLRELEFRPEQQLQQTLQSKENQEKIDRLLAEKRSLLQQPKSRSKHLKIKQINGQLQPFLEKRRAQLKKMQSELQVQSRADRLLSSREFAFCLFEEKSLSDLLLEIVGHKPYIYKS